jgi:hypothetical protein
MSEQTCGCPNPDPVMQADGRFYCHTCSFRVPAVLCMRCQGVAPVPPPAPPQWQSIETAPKDGRMILVYPSSCWTDDTEGDFEVTYWDEDMGKFAQCSYPDDYSGPTHWQPLPPAPRDQEP